MITSSFYKGAHGVMLAYDTTSQETLAPLKGWDGDVDRYHGNPSIVAKMVVGTKKDLAEQRTVTPEEGQAMAAAIGKDVLFAETHDPKYRCCTLLRKMVRGGKLGRKSGEGFYKYN